MPSSPSADAPSVRARRASGAAVALLLAVLTVLVPVPAHAADAVPGGATPATAVPLPVADLDAQFTADTSARTSNQGAGQSWYNVGWYTWTPASDVRVYVRATSLAPGGWDNTLEVWSGGALVVTNDDSYGLDAAVTVDMRAGRTYQIGVGGYHSGSRGTATIQFSTRVPSAPTDLVATPGDGAVTLTWHPPTDVAGGVTTYTVTCTPPGGQPFVCATRTGTPPATTVTIPALVNGASYGFAVTASNLLGPSVPTASVTAVPQRASTTSLRTEPASLVSGRPFDLHVRVAGAAAGATVDVTVGADVRTAVPVVDGDAVVSGLVASAGPLHLAASYAGDAATRASSATADVTVARRPHVVTLAALPADLVYGGAGVQVQGASSLGLPLTYTASGACAVSGAVLHLVDVGTCTVTAAHPGDAQTEAASASVDAQVGRRSQRVTVAPLPVLVYGQEPTELVATSDAGLPVTLTGTGACRVDGGHVVVTDVGACTVTATQDGDARTTAATAVVRQGDVARRSQTVTITAFPTPTLGAPTPPVVATSPYGLPVALSATGACTVVDGALVAVSAGPCTVTATAQGDARTLPGQASVTVQVTGPAGAVDVTTGGTLGASAGGATATARGVGLLPGSELALVVHSTPRTIGTARVGIDGTAIVTGVLPADLEPGVHRLVVTGTAFDGSPVSRELGLALAADGTFVRIGDDVLAAALATTGATPGGAAGLAASWLLLGAGLVVLRRRAVRAAR